MWKRLEKSYRTGSVEAKSKTSLGFFLARHLQRVCSLLFRVWWNSPVKQLCQALWWCAPSTDLSNDRSINLVGSLRWFSSRLLVMNANLINWLVNEVVKTGLIRCIFNSQVYLLQPNTVQLPQACTHVGTLTLLKNQKPHVTAGLTKSCGSCTVEGNWQI